MHDVTAAFSFHSPKNWHSQKREVTDDVENLMADKLVFEAQAGLIEHAIRSQDDGIIKGATPNQIRAPQGFDLLSETERARRCYLVAEVSIRQFDLKLLYADQRMREIDQTIDLIRIS